MQLTKNKNNLVDLEEGFSKGHLLYFIYVHLPAASITSRYTYLRATNSLHVRAFPVCPCTLILF